MKKIIFGLMLIGALKTFGQESLTYQIPSKEIYDLVDVSLAPSVVMDDAKNFMIFLYRDTYKSIEDLSSEELRLAGLRIDPKTNIGSRITYYNNLKIQDLRTDPVRLIQVTGLPNKPKLTNIKFSPDQKKIAMTQTTALGVEVWYVDLSTFAAKRLTEPKANANLGQVIHWFKDSERLLVKMIPKDRAALINPKSAIPSGPTVSVSDGQEAPNRTYQDLLKNKNDEHNFEQLALSVLHKVSLKGSSVPWLGSAMYQDISFSPDGEYIMISVIKRPFSYLVPNSRFPSTRIIYTKEGQLVSTVAEAPLMENLPKGFMAVPSGRRSFRWRNDQPASLVFVKALDEGNPDTAVAFRDEVFQLEAPFDEMPKSMLKTQNRFSGIVWGNKNLAIAYDYWWNTRNKKTYLFNPSLPGGGVDLLFDQNYQDVYNDPGSFITRKNKLGRNVLAMKGSRAYLKGNGYSHQGQFPFLDEINLKSKIKNRLYQSGYKNKLERFIDYDIDKNQLLVRIESPNDYPNYFMRDFDQGDLKQMTQFENPFVSIKDIHKEVISYKRADGLELSATLYLPVGYNKEKKEKMPMILWAYPREFKDQSSASQKTSNPNTFTNPYYGSPIYWVTKGYVILDRASFPILGAGDTEPNDTFIKQLVGNAQAAIDAADALGYIDRNRVAVGGHSYGAFMVANLLSHSDLFAAGIARSGAYNRTLTPFGFQSEQRSYWEAPEVYYNMSPFMHADKMKTPLLLTHGEADNNSGTYPMQSIRYFNALKGLGAEVRLVLLPKESHGYRAKENILHLLWEQDQWLEKYVKNKD
ncbi:prolyl oligopeptidase family serine peptidase [Cyclobacteriaceae bacterium]|nr:prolyl oligopeptidase family serine peptidase [Cyclobacteriaceae bacterium]